MVRYRREEEAIADALKATRRVAREASRPTGTETALTTAVAEQAAVDSLFAKDLAQQLEGELGPLPGQIQAALDDAQSALTEAGLARSEAAAAVEDAQQAAADASQAISDALAAASLAAGSNTWADAAPTAGDADGKPVGAVWFQYDGEGLLAAVWELRPLGWVVREFDEAIIPQVAIGTGTYGSLSGSRIVAKSILADQIAALAITAEELAANAVTAVKIAANAVTAEKINAGAVTTDKLDALAVTAEKIAAGAIIAEKIAAGAITTAKLAATAIDGMTITGALIRTAPSGQRLEFDATGITGYNTAGQRGLSIAPDGRGLVMRQDDDNYMTFNPASGIRYVSNQSPNGDGTMILEPDGIELRRAGSGATPSIRLEHNSGGYAELWGLNTDLNLRTTGDMRIDSNSSGESDLHLGFTRTNAYRLRTAFISAAGSSIEVVDDATFAGDVEFQGTVGHQGDTDWANITIPGGSGVCRWRRVAGKIRLEFNVSYTNAIPAGGALAPGFTLPVAARPAVNTPLVIIGSGSREATGYVEASTGNSAIKNASAVAKEAYFGWAEWFATS